MVGPLESKSGPSKLASGATRRTARRPDSRRAPARGLRRHAADFKSVQLGPTPVRRARRSSRRRSAPAQVKVGLILPLSASGNAGVAAQSMKNAAEMALAEFQNPNIQLLIKDDGGSPQGAQPGNPAGARRRRRDHSGSAVRAVGAGDGAADARARRLGDRVLDRFERRRPRRLSAELPAGIRRQPDRRIRRRHRKAIVRRAAARQCLWQCGRGRVQAGGRPQGRAHRRVRKIRRRSRHARRAPWRRRSAGAMRCSSPTTATPWCRWPTR